MLVETIAEKLFFNPVRLEADGPGGSWTGTGFIYSVNTADGAVQVLVTNKHVLRGAERLKINFMRAAGDRPMMGVGASPILMGLTVDSWVGHREEDIDVAVIPLARIIEAMAQQGEELYFKSITPELTLNDEDDLDAMEGVLFIGYPSGLFDRVNLLPIARRGWTATPIRVDYNGRPQFLIDASVFPGSSGSPVFILDRGTVTGRSGNVTIGTRVIFLGVLAAVHTRILEGTVEVVTATPIARFNEPIDLGVVYKASCVLETIDGLLSKHGLTRLPSVAPVVDGASPSPADEIVAEAERDS
ncbi:serine protease [Oerskovia sp. Root22]|uniref:trypsin-like peptidase domain-containing protein n=1 Tax=Oerskovia sp. Root22 TaxID=1736494 RepID=UPI0009E9C9CA|nr:serine protease [Oerskovia sp. Root22]